MKATLEYDLPEEWDDFKITYKAGKYYSALWNIMNVIIRSHYKHGNYGEEATKIVEEIRDKCWEEIGDLLDE